MPKEESLNINKKANKENLVQYSTKIYKTKLPITIAVHHGTARPMCSASKLD